MSLKKKVNQNRAIIVVGRTETEKMAKAMSFVSENPIVQYANEYNIEDNHSIPIDRGIIIDEVHYRPNIELVRKTILEYQGQVVLLSDNQKDVSKKLFNLCQLKRATKKTISEDIKELAPRSEDAVNYDIDTFSMVREYLKNPNREEVRDTLSISKPPDVQIMTWLAPNVHPNKLSFVDSVVKRRWSNEYFYDMLAYSHAGRLQRKMEMPKRKAYSQIPKICRKLKLKKSQTYLLRDLLKDDKFREFAKSKLDNTECRILKLGEKKRRKRYAPVEAQASLETWL
tara:strand:+ start:16980 stop:17831 length:852 start_codon:yes stop_codon:yes gene_type:complete